MRNPGRAPPGSPRRSLLAMTGLDDEVRHHQMPWFGERLSADRCARIDLSDDDWARVARALADRAGPVGSDGMLC